MSGGVMDYVYTRIESAADCIQQCLANAKLRASKGRLPEVSRTYQENYPGVKFLESPEALQQEVIKRLSEALITVRKAAIYAHRVEWWLDGDDGDEAFCLRTAEELEDCDKHEGVDAWT